MSSDANTVVDQNELELDARFDNLLERVSFQPGVMLGSKAMTAEQTYHLRRLTRHQRWLVGPGTLFGLRVTLVDPATHPDDPADIRLHVGPGYAIDGLGREVLVGEPYAVSLRDWLKAEKASPGVAANYESGKLYLRVTVRSRACPRLLQPVAAELFDAGVDPVTPARIADSFQLEILGDDRLRADAPARPLDWWSPERQTPAASDIPGKLTKREQATLDALAAPGASALKLHAWLLDRTFPPFDDSPGADSVHEEEARLPLASVHVALADLNNPAPTAAGTEVNNLVRPFIRPNILLAALSPP